MKNSLMSIGILALCAFIFTSFAQTVSTMPPSISAPYNVNYSVSNVRNIFSIGFSPNQNIYSTNKPINVSISLTIPSQYKTISWSQGVNNLVQTECGYFIVNQTSVITESNVSVLSNLTYTKNFEYTPKNSGIYDFGAVCQSSSITWNSSSGTWNSWTTPLIVASQNQTLQVSSSSITPPPPVNLTNQFFNFLSQLISDIENFIKSIIG